MDYHWIHRKLFLTNHLRTQRVVSIIIFTLCLSVLFVNADTYTDKSPEQGVKQETSNHVLPGNEKSKEGNNTVSLNDLQQYNQIITIKGKVFDSSSEPLIGVSILVKGSQLGTTTDLDGRFEIRIPLKGLDGAILQFTYIGYKSKEVIVSESRTLPVVMEEDVSEIGEVVVTGYQVVDKRYSTSAITSVKASDVLVPGMTSIDQALEGRIPELLLMNNSGEVGSTPRLRVRGTSTLLGNREPLWVLDGFILNDPVAVSNDELNDPDYINIIGNAIAGINPQDIDRIDVLKDASATALYGTRAANGVIVVTTKKGTVGKPKLSYSHSSKVTSRPRYTDRNINLMNSQERVQFGKDLSDLHYQFPSNMTMVGYEGALHRYYTGLIDYSQFLSQVQSYEVANTDWFKILTRDSYTTDHTLGLSGGADNMRYYSSLGYSGENGVSKTTFSDRYTMRTNMNFTLSEKVLANFSVNGNFLKKNSLNSNINLIDYAYNTTRALPFTNPDGSLYFYDHIGYGGKNRPSNKFRYNILNELNQSSNTYEGSTLGASLDLRFKITNDLETSVSGNYSRSNTLQEQWWGEYSHYVARLKNGEYEEIPKSGPQGYSELPYGGILKPNETHQESYTFRFKTDYRRALDEAKNQMLSAMAGLGLNSNTSKSSSDELRGFVRDRGLQFIDQVDLEKYPYYSEWHNKNRHIIRHNITKQISGYFTLSYSYKNHFVLNTNGRFDASNKLGSHSNKKLLPVWSISGMLNLKDIIFDDFKIMDEFIIRSSFGIQGNMLDDQSPNLIIKQGVIDPFYNENVSTVARYPNPNLLWEKTNQYNLEFNTSFFKNRISINATYYSKNSTGVFTHVKVSSVNGVPGDTYVMNGGNISNKGYSVGLQGYPIRNRDFSWNASTYISGNFNKVRSGSVESFGMDDYLNGTAIVDGQPISTFYSYKFMGLSPFNGTPIFNDYSDQQHLLQYKALDETLLMVLENSGQREPILSGSLYNSLTYKRLSLTMNMSYNIGGKVRLFALYAPVANGVNADKNVRKEFVNRWKAPGDEAFTNIPVIMSPSDLDHINYVSHYSSGATIATHIQKFANSVWDMYDKSDLRVVSASYLKLSSLSMRYSFNPKLLKGTPFSNAQVSLSGMNLYTLSSKALKGQDPSQARFSQPNLSIRPSYTLQFNLTF